MSRVTDNEDERQLETQNGINRINDADDCEVEEYIPSDQPHRQNVTILQFQIGTVTPESTLLTSNQQTAPAPAVAHSQPNNQPSASSVPSTTTSSNVDSAPTLSSIRATAVASLAHSIHVQVSKTDQPNIISIHVYLKVPLPTEKVKQLLEEHLQAVASSDSGLNETTTPATAPASTSAALASALPLEKAPPPLTSIVRIMDDATATSTPSASSVSSSSSDQLPSTFVTSPTSTLVRFSIPQYNFAKHNYLAASRHFFHSYSILTLIQEEYLGSSFSEESLSALIEKAVEQSYQMWAKGERTSSNTALLSVLSSLKISWLCASSFLEEEVELSDLLFLTEDDIKSFVPKLGPRRRLMKWIQQQRDDKKMKQLQQQEDEDEEAADAVGEHLNNRRDVLLSPSALSPSPSSSTPSTMAHSDGEGELSSMHQPEWSMSRSHADATHEESEHHTEQSELEADEEPSTHRKDEHSAAVEEGDEDEAGNDEEDEFDDVDDDGEDALNVTDATSDVTDAVSTLLDSPHVQTSDHTDHPATEASEVDRDHSDTEEAVLHRSDTSADTAVESEEENEIGEKILPFQPGTRLLNPSSVAGSTSSSLDASSSSNVPIALTSTKGSHLRSSSSSVLDDSIECLSQPHEDDGYEGHDESDEHQTTHEDDEGEDEEDTGLTRNNSNRSKRSTGDEPKAASVSSQTFKKESGLRKQRTKARAPAAVESDVSVHTNTPSAAPVTLPLGLAHYYTDESGHTIPMQLSQIDGVLYAIPIPNSNVQSSPAVASSSSASSSATRPIPILAIPARPVMNSDPQTQS